MKRYYLVICFIITITFCQAQSGTCNVSTLSPTDIFFAGPAYDFTASIATHSLYLCPNAVVYDTALCGGDRYAVMINAGANYIWRPCGPAASLIYIKNGGTLTYTTGGSPTYTQIHFETGSTILNLPTTNTYTYLCSSLSFPSINCFASINELESNLLSFSVYPNPSSSSIYLNLQSDASENINITFYNQLGETVLQYPSWNSSKKEIPVCDLSNGVYFISIQSKGISRTKKIVVLK